MKQNYNSKNPATIFKSNTCKLQLFLIFLLTLFSVNTYSQTTYTFNYTGAGQTINLPAGTYTIQTWGADGGDNLGNGSTTYLQNGGKGGYSVGTYTLGSPTTIYVYVGGRGSNSTSSLNVTAPGGYNGGGYGSANSVSGKSSGAGGGGATHVATATGVLSALASSQPAVIIVGAGGGGAGESNYTSNNTQYNSNGGNGGGASGLQNITSGYQGRQGQGGTQTAGGGGGDNGSAIAGVPLQGIFGAGGYNTATGSNSSAGGSGAGGGGGGWYGGGSGWVSTGSAYQAGSGGGGSGYIGGVTNGTTVAFGQSGFITNPASTGDGMVLIKELCSITLAASNATLVNSTSPVICSGQSLTLTTNAISNYSWSTGATSSSLVVAPTTNTVYTLTATSPSNCSTSRTISVTVSGGQPTLSVVSSTNSTCLGKTATLTASGAVTYTWTNGVTNGVSFFPSATTTYTVSGENGCGIVQAVSTISVNPLAVTAVSTSTALCVNKTATLSVTASATSYTFEPGNITQSSPSLIVNPQTTTNYTITVSDGTCSGVTNINLVANPIPTLNISATSSIVCPGGSVNLTVTGGGNYTWSPGNQSGNSISVSPSVATLYSATGDNNFGCFSSSSQVIVVGAKPNLLLSASSNSICAGETVTMTISGADTYAWTNGPTATVNIVTPATNTVYSVTGTNTTSTCSDTQSTTIAVFQTILSITGNSAVCDGNPANLQGTGATSYTWNPGAIPFPGVAVTPVSTTVYTLSAIGTTANISCPASGTFEVKVNPNPTITTLSNPNAICPRESGTVTASGASTYTWTNSTGGTVTGAALQYSASVASIMVFSVVGTSSLGCDGNLAIPLTVYACTGLEQLTTNTNGLLAYPNPNGGDFTIRTTNTANVKLINALGQLVREFSLSPDNDHSVNISDLPRGVYFIVSQDASHKVVVDK